MLLWSLHPPLHGEIPIDAQLVMPKLRTARLFADCVSRTENLRSPGGKFAIVDDRRS